jgi:predicted CXXCH cytochrome family protein
MNASGQCLVCHRTGYDRLRRGVDTYDTRWREIGVGCEACHGPGRARVDARRTGARSWREADTERLLDACGSCHAQRVERAAYTPGDVFLDAFEPELLDTESCFPDGQVKEELYELVSFQQSKMFQEGVRCWNCHDPHADGTRETGNALCRTCHETRYETGHTRIIERQRGRRLPRLSCGDRLHAARSAARSRVPAPGSEATIATSVERLQSLPRGSRRRMGRGAREAWYPEGERARRQARGHTRAIARRAAATRRACPA